MTPGDEDEKELLEILGSDFEDAEEDPTVSLCNMLSKCDQNEVRMDEETLKIGYGKVCDNLMVTVRDINDFSSSGVMWCDKCGITYYVKIRPDAVQVDGTGDGDLDEFLEIVGKDMW